MHMTSGTDELHIFYDAQNRPAVVVYNGTAYAYVKSLQGDIVAILDENGNTVVSYGYDAWGAPLRCTGELAETLGKVQPFRYRGYVFDEETGLYYLRSRYYNPELSRFYGSDRIYKGNLFAYCCNQVLNTVDRNGKDAIWITDETGLSHSSVLIQDDKGDWYYYYWGAAGNNGSSGSSKMGSNASSGGMGNVCVIYEKIEITITDKNEEAILGSLNEILHTEEGLKKYDYKNNYTSCIYLGWNYVKSHEMAIYLRDNAASQHYDLKNNNCVQSVADIVLASAEYATETPQGFFDELRAIREEVHTTDFKTWIPRKMHEALRKTIGE